MPIYEYHCQDCGREFELLVLPRVVPACPACQGANLERRISVPAVKSDTTHALALKAAKRRDQKLGAENARAQREYELKHDD